MNTPSISNPASRTSMDSAPHNAGFQPASVREARPQPADRNAGFQPAPLLRLLTAAASVLLLGGGCGYAQGELAYMLGFGRGKLVEAEFTLTEEPILILVDDYAARVDWPPARHYLVDELGQELIKKGAAKKIIPRQRLQQIRQTEANFEKRGVREIGELAGAEQVMWIEVQDFAANPQFDNTLDAAYYSVTVKIINVLEKERRSRVRVWPTSPSGQAVTVSMTGSEVTLAKTKDAISKQLAEELAVEIAKPFYKRRLGDFEKE